MSSFVTRFGTRGMGIFDILIIGGDVIGATHVPSAVEPNPYWEMLRDCSVVVEAITVSPKRFQGFAILKFVLIHMLVISSSTSEIIHLAILKQRTASFSSHPVHSTYLGEKVFYTGVEYL